MVEIQSNHFLQASSRFWKRLFSKEDDLFLNLYIRRATITDTAMIPSPISKSMIFLLSSKNYGIEALSPSWFRVVLVVVARMGCAEQSSNARNNRYI